LDGGLESITPDAGSESWVSSEGDIEIVNTGGVRDVAETRFIFHLIQTQEVNTSDALDLLNVKFAQTCTSIFNHPVPIFV
jgi:hypothetical protein